jgi:hypothetical protein
MAPPPARVADCRRTGSGFADPGLERAERAANKTAVWAALGRTINLDYLAISPHWVVWQADHVKEDGHRFSIYRAPITGGPKQRIGVVNQPVLNVGYYATDDYVYWSPANGGGVNRMSMTDGTLSTLPGFEGTLIDGSPWVRIPRPAEPGPSFLMAKVGTPIGFRNVVSGERRSVTMPPDVATLKCVPAFCVAVVKETGELVIERLDGTGRIALPRTKSPAVGRGSLLNFGDGGLVVLDDVTLLDPLTGKLAATPSPKNATCGYSPGSIRDAAVFTWSENSPPGSNVCPMLSHTAYILGP